MAQDTQKIVENYNPFKQGFGIFCLSMIVLLIPLLLGVLYAAMIDVVFVPVSGLISSIICSWGYAFIRKPRRLRYAVLFTVVMSIGVLILTAIMLDPFN